MSLLRIIAVSALCFLSIACDGSPTTTRRHKANVVCRSTRISGFDDCYERAKPLVGNLTSDIADMKVFITVSGGAIYAHSNFQTPGAQYPTKIATSDSIDALNLVHNLVGKDVVADYQLQKAVRDDVIFIVEKESMSGTGLSVDFGGAGRVYSVDQYNARRLQSDSERLLAKSRVPVEETTSEIRLREWAERWRREQPQTADLQATRLDSRLTELVGRSTPTMRLFSVSHSEAGAEIVIPEGGTISISSSSIEALKRGERLRSDHPLTKVLELQKDGALVLFTKDEDTDVDRADDMAFAIQKSYPEKRIYRDPFSEKTAAMAEKMNEFKVSAPDDLVTVIAGDSFEVTDWKILQNIEPSLKDLGCKNVRSVERGQVKAWDGGTGKAVIVITGHIDDKLAAFIQELGEAGFFRDNAVLLDTCRMPATRDLASRVCNEYGAFGAFCYDSKIEAAAVEDFVLDIAEQVRSGADVPFVDLINGTIGKHALNGVWTLCDLGVVDHSNVGAIGARVRGFRSSFGTLLAARPLK